MDSIWVSHLVRRYGGATAVDDLSLAVTEGELFGFVGPNGAGKTTTIGLLCTLLRPTSGQVRINGFDVVHQPAQVRRTIGLVFQEPTLDFWLTAWENLALHARVYDLPRATWQARGHDLLRTVGLWERRHDLVRSYSGGMRRGLEVVRGLLHRPRVLFLMIVGLVLTPLVLVSGALFPIGQLPGWLARLAWLNPLSYGVDAIRQVILTQAGAPSATVEQLSLRTFDQPLGVPADLVVVAASTILMALLAVSSLRPRE